MSRPRATFGVMLVAIVGIAMTLVGGAMTAAGTRLDSDVAAASVLGVQMTRLGDDVRVTGPSHVGELEPGHVDAIKIALRNRGDREAEVRAFDVTVGDASDACSRENVTVAPVISPIRLDANATTTIRVDVVLDPAAPRACRSETFPLTYAAAVAASH